MYKKCFKRIIDVFISLIGLLVLIVPMLVIALIIVIDSDGGALLKQKRLGRNQKNFTIYKFRTMVPNAYSMGGSNTYSDDPRITRVGRFLRKTSIDELPQLINIIKGDMSIIGPRPILPEEFEEYKEKNEYSERFGVRPGLFCTVDLDYRAEASRELQFRMDAEYCRNIFFSTDVKTFFGVIKTVVKGENVYKQEREVPADENNESALVTKADK